MRGFTAKQLADILSDNGWIKQRQKGSHITFGKTGSLHIISIPYHSNNYEVSRPMAKRLLREAGISL